MKSCLDIIEMFGFNCIKGKEIEQFKVILKDIPDYEIFSVLTQAITNDSRDDMSRVVFQSNKTIYDTIKDACINKNLDESSRYSYQMQLDYCDGKSDDPGAFYRYKDREEPKKLYVTYTMDWLEWDRNKNLYDNIRASVDNMLRKAKHDGTTLHSNASTLKFYRIKNGMTQDELAKSSGVLRSKIAKIENGTINIENCTGKVLLSLAKGLNISIEELIDNTLRESSYRKKQAILRSKTLEMNSKKK